MSKALEVGDNIEVEIGPIAHGGHFIARHNGQVVFVRHAITDEKVIVEITSVSSKLARGDAIKILKPSPDRIKESCEYAVPGGCGGCDFQHINYSVQSDLKKEVLKDQFKRITKIDISPEIVITDPSDGLHWRSRLNLAISENKKVGLRAHKSNTVIEIDECLIALKEINNSNIFSKNWDNDENLKISRSNTNEINISQFEKSILGPDKLTENVDKNEYTISPKSFWQSHINAPSLLLQQVISGADIKQNEILCDLYGGVGLFTLPISKLIGKNGQVHLIEMDEACIKDAKFMFENIENIYIHHGTVEQKLGSVKNIDTIILDPPRNGVSKQVINQIIEKKPNTIVYVSCSPSTLARDSKVLLENKYILSNIVGLDLFPMTHHIESVASFKKI